MSQTARVTGLNHLTFAVGDLERSVAFYRDVLGCELRAIWATGAYLEAGSLWLCLSLDAEVRRAPHADYTHAAFSVEADAFEALAARLRETAVIWKDNRSEGASLYFLDPDGHRLELHVGDLETRLRHYRERPELGVTVS
ncbi:MAG: fosfomycin resistance glutathione transferase [Brevundimonas sp.]|uniref:fosfomycin resistance glutathione transferase n=1 Tax=Brevundimonas sp. TaxID=1871086 RepID=UPI0018227628|nr:fosfomycin resistance glutathione transferase [Brevundimonas sp.]MBA4805018.1 fosfomycin resistance glutathione transferase [Brevundimonas sp.]